jgi:beta-1,4-N-acetylglucosaminyltransferase
VIFVALGTHEQPFDRALDVVAALAATETLVVQHGHTPPGDGLEAQWLEFADYDTIVRLMVDASAVVCHAGVGTVMTALGVGKTPVVVPRLCRFGEHVDDHQLQITEAFAGRGIVVPYLEGDDIRACVERAITSSGTPRQRGGDLIAAVAGAAAGESRGSQSRSDAWAVPDPARPAN